MANIVARQSSVPRERETVPFDPRELQRLRAAAAVEPVVVAQTDDDLEVEIEIENAAPTKRGHSATLSDPLMMSVLVEIERRESTTVC